MPAEGQGTPEPHPEDPPASQGAPPEAAPQEPEKPEETDKATEEPAPVKLSPAERRRQEAAERKAALAAAKAAKREAAKAKAEAKKAALAEAKAAKKGAKTKTQRGDVAKPDEGATGTLTLKIRPWANVWVNKKKVGTTPLPPLSLKAGKHTVKLVNDELKVTRTQTVVVEAGKNVDLKMNLGD
jgi:serine/threonine-protein kinase